MAADKNIPEIRFKGFEGEWEESKLSEMTDYKNGRGHEDKQGTSGKYELINLNSISIDGGLKNSGKFIDESDTTLLENDLVMVLSDVGHGDLLGRVALIPENNKYVLNQRVALLRPNNSVNPLFLFVNVNAHQSYFKAQGAGMSQLNISKSSVEDFISHVPSIPEQTQIGTYFQNLDSLISLHQRKYDKLLTVKKAMLEKMFPKEGADVPEIRFNGFDGKWEKKRLGEIATMKARIGWQGMKKSEFLEIGDYYLITGTDFANGLIDFSNCNYISFERYSQDINIQIMNDDVLITKDGTIGKVAYVKDIDKPATLNAGVFVIRGKENICNLFMYHYLAAPYLLDYADKQATGGTIKHLNQNVLVNFPLPFPCFEEQTKIGTFFQNLDTLIMQHQKELEKLKNLKKACLEKMFV